MPARSNEKLDRIINHKFTSSFMSNSKWRKLFIALDRPELNTIEVIWKFIDAENEERGNIPKSRDLLEEYVGDFSLIGPFAYKHIEWVEIPYKTLPRGFEKIPFAHRAQDVSGALAVLKETGQFEIAETDRGLRIYGFK